MKTELVYINEFRVELDYSVEENLKSFKEEVLNRLYTIHKDCSVDALMFSGGMDSTLILASLLKNLNEEELESIMVCCSIHSLIENPEFWRRFVFNKLKQDQCCCLGFIRVCFLKRSSETKIHIEKNKNKVYTK
jgi:3'-phosphoadenosine 5'-phosphosulfate sulfotransferase (PAPS reductase)/FAD synthetase